MQSINIIAAVGEDRIIGQKQTNSIPWDYPQDMQRFAKLTRYGIVIMGRRTFESIGGKPLSNRLNFVVTNQTIPQAVFSVRSLEGALDIAKNAYNLPIWLIGGESIYTEGLQYADYMFLTRVPDDLSWIPPGHRVRFPDIDLSQWTLSEISTLEDRVDLRTETWKRNNK